MNSLSFREKLMLLAVLLVGAGYAMLYAFLYQTAWHSAERAARRTLDIAESVATRTISNTRETLTLSAVLASRDAVLHRALAVRQTEAVRTTLAALARRSNVDLAWVVASDGSTLAEAPAAARVAAKPLPQELLREAGSRGTASRFIEDGSGALIVTVASLGADASGWLVFAAPLGPRLADALNPLESVKYTFASMRSVELMPSGGTWIPDRRLFTGEAGTSQMAIILSHPKPETESVFGAVQSRLLIAAAAALALAAGLSLWFANLMMQPVERMNRAIRRVLAGDFTMVPHVRGNDEMGRLSGAFNLMVEGLLQRERKMLKLAYRDALTALPNRTLFAERLEEALSVARRESRHVSVMFVDLDRFKQVNDSLGHQAGDALLKEVADRVRTLLRGADSVVRLEASQGADKDGATVARMGGDEFAILLPGCDAERARRVASRVSAAVRRPFTYEGQVIDFGASIGIASFPDHAADADSLMQTADIAMYEAKSRQLGISVFDPAVERDREAHLSLLGDLRRALELDELRLMFQPKVSLRGDNTLMAESLLRWDHPERGPQDPGEFVPFAEKTGFVTALTHWVIDRSLSQIGNWRREGLDINIAVNISSRDLVGGDLAGFVSDRLSRYEVPAASLTVELTESAMMQDPEVSKECLTKLSALGVKIAIDDFGTGFASLAQLRELPVDSMKIDRGFVARMALDRGSEVIVRSTIELAHSLGLTVVAEGVEDGRTLGALQEMGCDFAQGYYFGKPLHASDFPSWVRHQARRHLAASAPSLSDMPVGV